MLCSFLALPEEGLGPSFGQFSFHYPRDPYPIADGYLCGGYVPRSFNNFVPRGRHLEILLLKSYAIWDSQWRVFIGSRYFVAGTVHDSLQVSAHCLPRRRS